MNATTPTKLPRPELSLLLLAFEQQDTVAEAVRGALAQTYSPLEIVLSDDASSDGTWAAIQQAIAGYRGPHRLVVNRNGRNLGIGAHLSRLVALSRGELLVVAAGDDVSLPQRCERLASAWQNARQRPDLLCSSLVDMDAQGRPLGLIAPTDLSTYRSAADWLARPPHVVGAAQAWTRRVFDRFGPLPAGVVGEDAIMVFRAIVSGGALTIAEPLVRYRRGGISRRRRALTAAQVVERLLSNNRHALVELPQLLADAALAGQLDSVQTTLTTRLAREQFIRNLFQTQRLWPAFRLLWSGRQVPLTTRLRLFLYAKCPGVLRPFFALKRLAVRARHD